MERGKFAPDQVATLLKPIKPGRVFESQGQSNVAGWEIKAHLSRIFGFAGWDYEITESTLLYDEREMVPGKKNWYVAYRVSCRLTIYSPDGHVAVVRDGAAVGDAQNQPNRADAHDMALKTADSQALKRAASTLGDQFGLSLYNKGSVSPLVGMTLVSSTQRTEPDITVSGEDHDLPATDSDVPSDAPERPSEPSEAPPAPTPPPSPSTETTDAVDGPPISNRSWAVLRGKMRELAITEEHLFTLFTEALGRPVGFRQDLTEGDVPTLAAYLATEVAERAKGADQ